ncbi:uncharacterized protein A4U43_C04F27480 [Asparagus officinalis]|uniref:Uncharacterized protein n=1 Tax=Asparagus officinalis TaxID=4686 RepID=A0A5P1F4M7_ASPOF|nr:uncharacterized protein A4U43_C04F27480 [Asparagus officinalis]
MTSVKWIIQKYKRAAKKGSKDRVPRSTQQKLDAKMEPDVGTTPPLVFIPLVGRLLVSIVESSKSKGHVLISLLPREDEMGMPPRSEP